MTQLVVISVPRTGSTHLGSHLRALTGLRVFGEVFNPRQSYSLKSDHFSYIADRWGTTLDPDISNIETVAWVRSHPSELFELFDHFAGDRVSSTKLFPGHLERDFVTGSLLPRTDVVTVILTRRVIDSYASGAKARASAKWRSTDTTELRVEGDIDEFRGWAAHQQAWYTDVAKALTAAGRPVNLLRYETDIDCESDVLLHQVEGMLRANRIDPGDRRDIVWQTHKQDLTNDPAKKFSNWDVFRSELEERGLLELAFGNFL